MAGTFAAIFTHTNKWVIRLVFAPFLLLPGPVVAFLMVSGVTYFGFCLIAFAKWKRRRSLR